MVDIPHGYEVYGRYHVSQSSDISTLVIRPSDLNAPLRSNKEQFNTDALLIQTTEADFMIVSPDDYDNETEAYNMTFRGPEDGLVGLGWRDEVVEVTSALITPSAIRSTELHWAAMKHDDNASRIMQIWVTDSDDNRLYPLIITGAVAAGVVVSIPYVMSDGYSSATGPCHIVHAGQKIEYSIAALNQFKKFSYVWGGILPNRKGYDLSKPLFLPWAVRDVLYLKGNTPSKEFWVWFLRRKAVV